jgi:hypothetical protein
LPLAYSLTSTSLFKLKLAFFIFFEDFFLPFGDEGLLLTESEDLGDLIKSDIYYQLIQLDPPI